MVPERPNGTSMSHGVRKILLGFLVTISSIQQLHQQRVYTTMKGHWHKTVSIESRTISVNLPYFLCSWLSDLLICCCCSAIVTPLDQLSSGMAEEASMLHNHRKHVQISRCTSARIHTSSIYDDTSPVMVMASTGTPSLRAENAAFMQATYWLVTSGQLCNAKILGCTLQAYSSAACETLFTMHIALLRAADM
jgi:hypothetical protein